ncbi:long-chain-fatty-acid--CoA ligase [Salinarimonas rosea]|uniref:long-chain-fatty-acid--CoA ligase n=1 Tax=Salinarimonas rosea TaxID=552063 RepID=UPI000418D926|nr:long-chain-fatty-acid--CoA ligase [Salinarimonas rosea]
MHGLMQDWPLLIHKVIDHAAVQHGGRAVVSRSVEGPIVRTTYAEIRTRALRLAKRLARDGIRAGDRVGTMAWNTALHLETWYGITGIGAVYHTLNPRLFEDQIVYIAGHAEDRLLFLDLTFVPLMERLQERLPAIARFVVLTDAAHMPETSLRNAVAYEDYLAEADDDFAWAALEENAAAGLCYTSGTTGEPKGVLYSHRSNVLHAMTANQRDALGLSSRDVAMPVVPLFHANGWSFGFSAPMAGATLVMPGPKLDGASLAELLVSEKVTVSAAVPTIWFSLLQHLDATGTTLPHLDRVVIGGSACPRAVTQAFRDRFGVEVMHAWGMTEMSPLGSVCSLKPDYGDLDAEAWLDVKERAGHAFFGIEMKIEDDEGRALPWDGQAFGRLKVRGPAVAKAYFHRGEPILDRDGFFDTGDVATIDRYGNMQVVDRSKDVIKSGGEWISSIELENLAVGHPHVAEAAAIGVPDEKWGERPLLVVVPKAGVEPDAAGILAHLATRLAKWQLPDRVVFVEEIPHTATGKIQKTALRRSFAGDG